MAKYQLSAVIPTVQYGNIQPTFEGDDLAALEAQIQDVWARYADKPLNVKGEAPVALERSIEKIKTFTNEDILYDAAAHIYTDLDGNELLGGSTYAKQFEKPFNKAMMLPICEKAWGVKADDIAEIWEMNSEISTSYGTALHKALELYAEHSQNGRKIIDSKISKGKEKEGAPNYVLPNHPYLAQVVKDFYSLPLKTGKVHSEVWLSCVRDKIAGQADRILQTGENTYRVQDFKTGKDIDKDKLKVYQHQLSFYAYMLKQAGFGVEPELDIFHHDGKEWKTITAPVLEIKKEDLKEK